MLGAPSPSCPPTTNLSSDSCSGDPADPGCARAKAQKSRNMLVNIAGKGEPLGADRGGVQGRSGRHRLGCGHRRFRNHHLPVAGGPEILSRGQVMAGTVETPTPPSPHRRADSGKQARLWQQDRELQVSSPRLRTALTRLSRYTFLIWNVLVPGSNPAAAGQAACTRPSTCRVTGVHRLT
jgi:hypothetical protein